MRFIVFKEYCTRIDIHINPEHVVFVEESDDKDITRIYAVKGDRKVICPIHEVVAKLEGRE